MGRAKPATEGRGKTGHFERQEIESLPSASGFNRETATNRIFWSTCASIPPSHSVRRNGAGAATDSFFNQPAHAVVAAGVTVIAARVLVNPPGRQSSLYKWLSAFVKD